LLYTLALYYSGNGRQGGQQQGGGRQEASGEEMGEMEQMMKWKMMTEMADMMMVYMDYKVTSHWSQTAREET